LPEEQEIIHRPGGSASWCLEAARSLLDESFQVHASTSGDILDQSAWDGNEFSPGV
jgi:hypothetical protein